MTETTSTNTAQQTPFFIGGADTGTGFALLRYLTAQGYPVIGAVVPSLAAAQALREVGGLPAYADPFRVGELRSVMSITGANPIVVNAGLQVLNEAPLMPRGWQKELPRIVEGTAALLEAAKAAGAAHFIHISYAFLYNEDSEGAVDETASLINPRDYENNPVLTAALKAEALVQSSGLPYTILRAGLIYGADVTNFKQLADLLRAGRYGLSGEGDTFSNWIHADDLANAVLLAAQRGISGETFNIVDDEPVSPNGFVREFSKRLGITPPMHIPALLAFLRGNMTNRVVMLLSAPALNRKAKQMLGWQPKYPSRATGFDAVLLEWRAREAGEKPVGSVENTDEKELMPV